ESGFYHLRHQDKTSTDGSTSYSYFSCKTEYGLTESLAYIDNKAGTVKDIHVRFSVMSKTTVIEQTFGLFKKMVQLHDVLIYDTEVYNHLARIEAEKDGKLGQWFYKPNEDMGQIIDQLCHIPLSPKVFRENPLGITKRERVINNTKGFVIEGGEPSVTALHNSEEGRAYLDEVIKQFTGQQ
ncbi:hypothetical protein OAE48_01605, partial [Flavobacteriales bacterium]|nr:hypothetical protein [Flavobacteriales bacterium]